uniref:histone acetyltransferase n=1 Tax=Caenorhabditis tropicalis TaxID=1561998 RepID=A0A1I7TLC2_9PELO
MFDINHPTTRQAPVLQIVQKQLVFLIHANSCMKKDETNELNVMCGFPRVHEECRLDHCGTFKNLLEHLRNCTGPSCTRQYCASSVQLIKHWKECRDQACVICAPIRRAQT